MLIKQSKHFSVLLLRQQNIIHINLLYCRLNHGINSVLLNSSLKFFICPKLKERIDHIGWWWVVLVGHRVQMSKQAHLEMFDHKRLR